MAKTRIMVVEDEHIIAFNLRSRLQRLGYEVTACVATGPAAIDEAGKSSPDLILMDIMLEGPMDGIQAAAKINESNRIPVVYLTASSDPETVERAKLTGPLGYLIKPFDENSLRITIEMALYKSEMAARLLSNERRFSETLHNIVAGVVVTDASGIISFMNPVAAMMAGADAGSALGQDVDNVLSFFDEDGRMQPCPIAAVISGGCAVALPSRLMLRHPDGSLVAVAGSIGPNRDEAGQIIGLVISFNDNAREREVQRWLERLNGCFLSFGEFPLENLKVLCDVSVDLMAGECAMYLRLLPEGIKRVACSRMDDTATCCLVCEKRSDWIGNALSCVGDGIMQLPATDLGEPWRDAIACQIHGEQRPLAAMIIMRTKETPVTDEMKRLLGLVVNAMSGQEERIVSDEARRTFQLQLAQSQKLEAIGTMASGVAHEINNPLMGIINYAQLLEDRMAVDNPLRGYAGEIIGEGERIARIVRSLLAFSRQEQEDFVPVSVPMLVDDVLSLVRRFLEKDEITLEVQIDEGLPELVCRQQQVEQVLFNLINNARDSLNLRFGEYHENKILRFFARRPSDAKFIALVVEDYGVGVPEEIRQKIFDPFFSTKPKHKGTGLGLSVSYGIVREHGGHLLCESEPGSWTRFIVELPVAGPADSHA